MKLLSWLVCILLCVVTLISCGRYAKPRPPEDFAPAAVSGLEATAVIEGVTLSWTAPQDDARGKRLKTIEGYRVYRKSLTNLGGVARLSGDEILLATIEDTHLKELEEMRQALIEQQRPARRVSLPPERLRFTYTDSAVTPSARYAYRVVPINQNGTEGLVEQVVQVFFRGDRSEIVLIPLQP